MRDLTPFSDGWTFCGPAQGKSVWEPQAGETVHLPHNAVPMPLNYFDDADYQKAFLYTKTITKAPEFSDKAVWLVFDGAMADAKVYINGTLICEHADGYTPFAADLTEHLKDGDNLLAVTVDGSENPQIPPFGGQIDYLTYAGLYREAWLKVVPKVSIGNVKVETEEVLSAKKTVVMNVVLETQQGASVRGEATAVLRTPDGEVLARGEARLRNEGCSFVFDGLEGIALWSLEEPTLYEAHVTIDCDGQTDSVTVPFGFRTADFRADGFYLNGKPLKLRGLNRHQSWPYVGYAMGRRAQERDAELMKNDLKCNIVRTSHYPQSKHFLNHCDRIGLLVFEEIPGWQHIGGPEWKQASIANTRAMIERDWNHPSIIIWGVRINESDDDHSFYMETNRLARSLDKTRSTGGVRKDENSELLEDVYTMNDFWMGANEELRGNRPPAPLRTPEEVTGLGSAVPYMVTEYNGHMFPTKRTDSEERLVEHVLRHLLVLNASYGEKGSAGAIGWCMFDYNTHSDFGSGDRICYHGVLDIFRQPKFAAWVYKSQCPPSDEPVLKPVTYWARGERSIGGVLPLIVLTNCDEISFQYGDMPPKRIVPDRESFPHLPYAPVVIDDRFVSPHEVGSWGMSWQDGSFVGYVDGKPVTRTKLLANPQPKALHIEADDAQISAAPKDTTRVVVAALDEVDNLIPYLDDVISLEISGPAKIIGPDILTLKAGSCAFWIETTGGSGTIEIAAYGQRMGAARVTIKADGPK